MPRTRDAATLGLEPKPQMLTQLLLNDHPELVATSGRRTIEENRAIPGATVMGHTSGDEVDFHGPRAVMSAARAQALKTPGTIAIIHDAGTGLHLHIRWPGVGRSSRRRASASTDA